jgi:NAD(P)-dependent dehydrogenase (short-subunit alcohol dehydrogenase family)
VQINGPIKELDCEVVKLDITSPEDIQTFKQKVGDQPIDILLNVAGNNLRLYFRYHSNCFNLTHDMSAHTESYKGIMEPPETDTLESVNLQKLQNTFAVNTFGPLLLTQALLANILAAKHPRIAVVSSRVGSLADNSSGGAYSYRASKAAVNTLFKSMAVDLREKNVPVLILHPGIVKTNLDPRWKDEEKSEVQGAVEPEQAASELWKVLMSKGLESTGRFCHRSGEELPW